MKDRKDRIITNAVRVKAFILENLTYDREEGVLYMRGRIPVPIEPGDEERGRRPRIRIGGQAVLASHAAYILRTGDWPEYPIKHLNGDETDIRWSNMTLDRRTGDDDEQQEALRSMANDKFLADLRRYHPKGPPTYQIKSGKPIVFHQYTYARNGYGNNPLAYYD